KVDSEVVKADATDGQSGTKSGLSPGTYTVSELAGGASPTALSDYVSTTDCSGEGGPQAGTSQSVTLAAGESAECTITNHRKPEIKVLKDVVPDSDTGKFDLKIDSSTFDNGGAGFGDTTSGTNFQQVSTGSHTVSEAGHGTTSLTDYDSATSCDSAKGASTTSSHTFSVAYGDKVTCTITNTRHGSIKVTKSLDPATDLGTFDLKVDSEVVKADATDGQSGTKSGLSPGTYTVSELAGGASPTALSDYVSTTDCSGEGGPQAGTSQSVTLAAGESAECTITNHRKPEIKVLKDVVPDSDTGKFDLKIDSSTFDNGGAGFGDTTSGTNFQQVSTGSHTVSEAGHGTTSLTDYDSATSCDSAKGSSTTSSHTFSVAYGDKVTCTITNTRHGSIKVTKSLDPATDLGTFDLKVDSEVVKADATDGQSGTKSGLSPGTYTVSELAGGASPTALSDYVSPTDCAGEGGPQAGTSQSVTLAAGESAECTITNHRKPEIKVLKDVVPDSDTGKFDLKIDSSTFDNGGAGFGDTTSGTNFQQVSTGSHTVSEAGHGTTSLTDYDSATSCDSAKGASTT